MEESCPCTTSISIAGSKFLPFAPFAELTVIGSMNAPAQMRSAEAAERGKVEAAGTIFSDFSEHR